MEDRKREAKEHHRRVADARPDILVYETEPLTKRFAFAGPLTAVLHASTTGRDADWFVTLCEGNAEGEIFQLTCGKIRARFVSPCENPNFCRPAESIATPSICGRFACGSQLQVQVAGAAFPLFSRNLN